MTIRSYIARLLSLGLAAAITTTAGFGQELPSSPAVSTTLPVVRTLTDTTGRKIEATIIEKSDTAIKVKTASGKEFTLVLTKLSAADQAFIAGLAAPPAPPVKPRTVLLMDDNADLKPLLEKAGFIVTIPPTEKLNEDDAGNPIAVSYKYVTLSKYTDDQLKAFDLIWKGTGIGGSMQDKTKNRIIDLISTYTGVAVCVKKWAITRQQWIGKEQVKQSEFVKAPAFMKPDGNVIFYSTRTTKFNPSEKHDELLEKHPEILGQVVVEATRILDAR